MEVGANDKSVEFLYSASGLVLMIIRLLIGEPQARKSAILRGRMQRMCCLVRGDEQSCRIQALAACLVPFGGRRMDDGWMDQMVTH